MSTWSISTTANKERTMTTAQFARELGIQPESLRKSIAKNGSYFGVVPSKALNGRLIWPASELARLKGGAA